MKGRSQNTDVAAEAARLLENVSWAKWIQQKTAIEALHKHQRHLDPTVRSPFSAKIDSPAKRLVRVRLYERVRGLSDLQRISPSVLMLAGQHPRHEVSLARSLCGYARRDFDPVLAVDLDRRAVDAARAVGVNAHWFDISDFKLSGPRCDWPLPRAPQSFHFVNLDLCGLVTSKNSGFALERASKIGNFVATWFSYGHDDLRLIDREAEYRQYLNPKWTNSFSEVPETIRKRLFFLWSDCYLQAIRVGGLGLGECYHVWSYVGSRMPMFVALWGSGWSAPKTVVFEKVSNADYRPAVLEHAALHGNESAAMMFDCSPAVIAAWKAVVTRNGKKK